MYRYVSYSVKIVYEHALYFSSEYDRNVNYVLYIFPLKNLFFAYRVHRENIIVIN